jgi:hypothetical protein
MKDNTIITIHKDESGNKFENYIEGYCRILSMLFKLSPLEEQILYLLVLRKTEILQKVNDNDLADELLFSPTYMKEIKNKLNMNSQNLNNYKISLIKKGILSDRNKLSNSIIPAKTITFKYDTSGYM